MIGEELYGRARCKDRRVHAFADSERKAGPHSTESTAEPCSRTNPRPALGYATWTSVVADARGTLVQHLDWTMPRAHLPCAREAVRCTQQGLTPKSGHMMEAL